MFRNLDKLFFFKFILIDRIYKFLKVRVEILNGLVLLVFVVSFCRECV